MIENFGINVFKEENLKQKLTETDFRQYKKMVESKMPLDEAIATKVAGVIKKWAIEEGATHYTHWFQPLNGRTAEKQTSFLSADLDNKPIVEFPVEALITGETDASSFPNGGLRSVFEARGFTKWDYTYPAFLKEDSNGKVLCIPTVLESPNGISLDKRTPLLNSCEALNTQLIKLLNLFGDNKVTETFEVVGIEQEYFLIKKEHYKKRKDLRLTGRTLFGAELISSINKHYMSSISEKTGSFMKSVEEKLWKLGVPAKVKHNEVAPRQYELVPHYEKLTFGANHDFLTMEILQKEAKKNELMCLLHEKPFKGINGSGKHNNWSIYTKEGENLFSYGKNAKENARFLTIIIALISAVDKHSDLIRATVATSSNDNRLSGYEAPSSIVSIYLGEELTNVIERLINDNENKIKLGETELSLFRKNITDRNRTSPFAFIGNRFEFRMTGSSASVAVCNTVLNTIMAESISEIINKLENSKDFYKDLKNIICEKYKEHSKIVYNGNSYSVSWEEESKNRGLNNIKDAPEAFKAFVLKDSINLFEKYNVYSKDELFSRYNIKLEKYIKNINTEAEVMIDMLIKEIMPSVIKYSNFLANSINNKSICNINLIAEKEVLEKITSNIELSYQNAKMLEEKLEENKSIEELSKRAEHCSKEIKRKMKDLREVVDLLETLVSKEYWPIPTYYDILN